MSTALRNPFTNLKPGTRTALGWILAAAVSMAHVQLVFAARFNEATFIWMYPLLLAVPGLLSMILLPGQFKRWYRWAAILGLAFSVYAEVLPLVLIIGQTYALHRAWAVERTSALKDLFTLSSRRKPVAGSAEAQTDSRSSKKPKAATAPAGKA